MGFEVRRIDVTGGLKFRGFRGAISGAPTAIHYAKQLGLGVTYHVLKDGQSGIIRGRLDDLPEQTIAHTLMPDAFQASHVRPSDLRIAESILGAHPDMLERFTPVEIPPIDWSLIKFAANPSRALFFATLPRGGNWAEAITDPEQCLFSPGDFPMHPLSQALHYDQDVWEGGSGRKLANGEMAGFRFMDIAKRFVRSITRVAGTPAEPEFYTRVFDAVLRANAELVPPYGFDGGAYLRPVHFGIGEQLGVNPSGEECLMVIVSPVGPYYSKEGGITPIRLRIEEKVHRAWPGGIGNVKASANYIIGLQSQLATKAAKFDENLYINPAGSGAEELGSGNFFTVRDGTLYTASLDTGTVLPGITRATVIEIARTMGYEVVEDDHHLMGVAMAQEAFVTGNAARITPVESVTFRQSEKVFGDRTAGPVTQRLYRALFAIQHAQWADRSLEGIPGEILEHWDREWLFRIPVANRDQQPVQS